MLQRLRKEDTRFGFTSETMNNLSVKIRTLKRRPARPIASGKRCSKTRIARKARKLMLIPSFGPEIEEAITVVAAEVEVRPGDTVYIRGQGSGLTWDAGQPMTWVEPTKWVWCTREAEHGTEFKVLLNDELWSVGENSVLRSGDMITVHPQFPANVPA